MQEPKDYIDNLFSDAFSQSEQAPPPNLWNALEEKLTEQSSLDSMFKRMFAEFSVKPSKNTWKKISLLLFMRSFFTFRFSSFNAYYLAALSVIGIYAAYSYSSNKEIELTQHEVEIVQPTLARYESYSHKAEQAPNSTQLHAETPARVHEAAPALKTKHEATIKQTIGKEKKTSKPALSDKKAAFDFTTVQIFGKSAVCCNMQEEYTIEGLPKHAEVEWSLKIPNTTMKFISTRKVVAEWKKTGNYNLKARVTVGEESAEIELPIKVESAEKPTIKGRNKVCEGTEKQLYSIDEPVHKNIVYEWKISQNKIDFIGNKYINVDWNKSGADTLFVLRIDTESGCQSENFFPVTVLPQPDLSYSITPYGYNEVQLKYNGKKEKGKTVVWDINGVEYTTATLNYENLGTDIGVVSLTVKDKNKCVATNRQEVLFTNYMLYVPRSITVNRNQTFLPQVNPNQKLASYTIEIYSPTNEKIWESSDLTNGSPSKAWDATSKGQPVPRGKYMWKINAVFEDGYVWNGVMQANGDIKPIGIVVVDNNN